NQNTLIAPRSINDGKPVTLADPAGHTPIRINITMESLAELTVRDKTPLFYIHVASGTAGIIYSVGPKPVQLIVPAAPGYQPAIIQPATDSSTGTIALPIIQGRSGTAGQQIRGAARNASVAVYRFNHVETQGNAEGQVPFEIKSGIEKNSDEATADDLTRMQAVVINR